MTDASAWVEASRGLAPMVACLGVGLLALRTSRAASLHPGAGRAVSPGAKPGLILAVIVSATVGASAAVLVGLLLGQDLLSEARILRLLAAQLYLLALAAFLSSWRLPLSDLIAVFVFVPAVPLQLLVHAGVLATPWDLGLYLLPPASFMVDLPAWATGTWSHGGWNPLAWPRGMAGPGFGAGALVWVGHVGVLLGLAGWGRRRQLHRMQAPRVRDTPIGIQSGK